MGSTSMKAFLRKIVRTIFYRNASYFYGNYLGSINWVHLIVWNIAKPGRTLTRVKYNRFFSRKWIGPTLASLVVESRGLSKNELKSRVTDVLNRNGAVVIEGYYNDDQLLALEEKYSNLFSLKDVRKTNESAYNSECLPLSDRLLTFWYDDLINIIE